MSTAISQLEQTLEQIQRLYRALATLREDVLPRDPQLFALMAEGPLAQITVLRRQLDEESGLRSARQLEADLWLHAEGAQISWPETRSSVLTALLDALRKGIQSVATYIHGGVQMAGRPPEALKQACDFEILALDTGSLAVGLRLPQQVAPPLPFPGQDPVRHALGDYLKAAAWVASDQDLQVLDKTFADNTYRSLLLTELNRLVPRQQGAVETIRLSGRSLPAAASVCLTRQSRRKIDKAICRSLETPLEQHEGRLREVDLDRQSFILRKPDSVEEVRCVFEEDLLETVKEALDKWIKVSGARKPERNRVSLNLRVLNIEISEPTSQGS